MQKGWSLFLALGDITHHAETNINTISKYNKQYKHNKQYVQRRLTLYSARDYTRADCPQLGSCIWDLPFWSLGDIQGVS